MTKGAWIGVGVFVTIVVGLLAFAAGVYVAPKNQPAPPSAQTITRFIDHPRPQIALVQWTWMGSGETGHRLVPLTDGESTAFESNGVSCVLTVRNNERDLGVSVGCLSPEAHGSYFKVADGSYGALMVAKLDQVFRVSVGPVTPE